LFFSLVFLFLISYFLKNIKWLKKAQSAQNRDTDSMH
jgi:hypothetical protein